MKLNVTPFVSLANAITAAEDAIDQAVGKERLRYLTDVAGQQSSYNAKHADAIAWLKHVQDTGSAPIPGKYPWVAWEALYTQSTEHDTAMSIATTGDLWNTQIGPELEGMRVGLKGAVRAAETIEEVAIQRKEALVLIPEILS